jgi:hypothetical protein
MCPRLSKPPCGAACTHGVGDRVKPLPSSVLHLLDTLPEAQAHKIVLNTDGHGQWDVEVYSRYSFHERTSMPPHVPLREKAVRHPEVIKKSS